MASLYTRSKSSEYKLWDGQYIIIIYYIDTICTAGHNRYSN